MANGFQGPPAVDFYSQLSGLGDTLQANSALRAKQQLQAARQGAFSDFSALDPNSPDYGKQSLTIAQKLGAAGDQDGAIKFLTMAQTNADRQHTYQREGVQDSHWAITDRRAASADARAAAAESRNAADYENTPDQYVPNPRAAEPGQPKFIDQYAEAKAAGEASAPGGGGASLNPVYGVGPDGKPAMVQTTKTGQAIQTKLPDGFQISKEPIKMDAGTHYVLIDPQTRQQIGIIPKNIAGAEAAKETGSAQGLAQVALPQALATSEQTLKTIDELKSHPGLDHSVGMWSVVPNVPGSAGADFAAKAAQLKGQTFLQAYQTLRGSGAITDIEGKKGEDAIAALDKAQSKPQYLKSLNDLADVVKAGMLRAKAKAQGPSVQQFPAASPEAVALLKQNGRVDDYEAIFGPGSAKQALTGSP